MDLTDFHNLLDSCSAGDIKKLKCPKCGNGLKISFVRTVGAPCMDVECQKCDFIERARLAKVPQWVSELENEIGKIISICVVTLS